MTLVSVASYPSFSISKDSAVVLNKLSELRFKKAKSIYSMEKLRM